MKKPDPLDLYNALHPNVRRWIKLYAEATHRTIADALNWIIENAIDMWTRQELQDYVEQADPIGMIVTTVDQSAGKQLLDHIKVSRRAKQTIRSAAFRSLRSINEVVAILLMLFVAKVIMKSRAHVEMEHRLKQNRTVSPAMQPWIDLEVDRILQQHSDE